MRNGLLTTLFFLLFNQGAMGAETLYVHDELRLGVRAAPSSAERSIAVVKTGDALTVLGEQENFVHIRTEDGIEGWVSKGYLSTQPPARTQLERLQKAHEKLQQQHEAVQQQLAESRQKMEQSMRQQQQLEQNNTALKRELARYTNSSPGFFQRYRWLIFSLLLLSCFVAGLFVGVRWKARRVAERIGGLEI
jgi:uncharacterized protein YgiM (DUF1202 family)